MPDVIVKYKLYTLLIKNVSKIRKMRLIEIRALRVQYLGLVMR